MSLPNVPANNFLQELLASHPQIGQLAWFTVTDQSVNQHQWIQAIIQAGLASYGMPTAITDKTAYLRGLHTLQHTVPQHTLIRRVEHAKDHTTHHWIEESVSQGQVHFRPLAAIERHHATGQVLSHALDTLHEEEDHALAHLSEFIQQAATTFTPSDRRRQIRQWFARAGALQMSHAGPVQFIADAASGLISALTQAQSDLGIHVWTVPLTRTDDVVRTLSDSLDTEVTKKTTALLRKVQTLQETGKDLTPHQQTALLQQMQDLDQRVQHYTEIFGTQLDNLTTQITVAKRAVRQSLLG